MFKAANKEQQVNKVPTQKLDFSTDILPSCLQVPKDVPCLSKGSEFKQNLDLNIAKKDPRNIQIPNNSPAFKIEQSILVCLPHLVQTLHGPKHF